MNFFNNYSANINSMRRQQDELLQKDSDVADDNVFEDLVKDKSDTEVS